MGGIGIWESGIGIGSLWVLWVLWMGCMRMMLLWASLAWAPLAWASLAWAGGRVWTCVDVCVRVVRVVTGVNVCGRVCGRVWRARRETIEARPHAHTTHHTPPWRVA